MNQDSPISLKLLVLTLSISLMICLGIYVYNLLDRRTKVVFCNVGKGNAVYVRVKNKVDILINAGPDKKVLNCLSKHLPFYDRTLEYVFLTEQTNSEVAGVMNLFGRYKINSIYTNKVFSGSKTKDDIIKSITERKIQRKYLTDGLLLTTEGFRITNLQLTTSTSSISNILFIEQANYRLELPIKASVKTMIALYSLHLQQPILNNLYLLQAPFYGSKDRLTKEFLMLADPRYVVISVKEQKAPSLPSTQLLDLLKAMNINYSRTDVQGDLVYYLK